MGGYFRGWKRKAGLMTLLLACALIVGWLRSYQTFDNVLLVLGRISLDIESGRGGLEIMLHRIFSDKPIRLNYFQRSKWNSARIQGDRLLATFAISPGFDGTIPRGPFLNGAFAPEFRSWRYQNRSSFCGITVSSGETVISGSVTIDHMNPFLAEQGRPKMKNRIETHLIAAPYECFVIPLTLLTAYLLLSRLHTKSAVIGDATT